MIKAVVITVVIVLSVVVGFVAGRSNKINSTTVTVPQGNNKPLVQVETTKSLQAAVNPLFKAQAATFQGKITSIAGKTLQVTSDSGEKGEFDVSDSVLIYKFSGNSAVASSSSDIKSIDTGKEVLISLNLVNGKYQAISISYFRTNP